METNISEFNNNLRDIFFICKEMEFQKERVTNVTIRNGRYDYYLVTKKLAVLLINAGNFKNFKFTKKSSISFDWFSYNIQVIGTCITFPDDTMAIILSDYRFNYLDNSLFSDLFQTQKNSNQLVKFYDVEFCLNKFVKRFNLSAKTSYFKSPKANKFLLTDSEGQFYHLYPLELSLHPLKRENIYIRETITRIGPFSFFNNMVIKIISFPASVTMIGKSSFAYCTCLRDIHFKKRSRLELIDESAFLRCYEMIRIKFPPSLKFIKRQAFDCCYNLREISFPGESKLKEIGVMAFTCTKIQSVTIKEVVNNGITTNEVEIIKI